MRQRNGRRGETRFIVALIFLYSVVGATYLVLPILNKFGGVLLGSALLPADVFLNSGILEWGFQSLFSPSLRFFDWNVGFPLQNTLAVTENLIGWQALYSPLREIGFGVAAAYNSLLLVSLLISGIGAALFARRLGTGRAGAAAAGLIFAYGPYHLNNLMHIQTMAVCWMPCALLCLDRYIERPNAGNAIGLAASFVITALSSVYFAVFLGLMAPLYATLTWAYGRYVFNIAIVKKLMLIAAVVIVGVSPVAYPYLRFMGEHGGYRKSAQSIASLSMEWLAPFRTPSFQFVWSNTPLKWPIPWNGEPAFFGVVAMSLAGAGIWRYKEKQSTRAVVMMLVTLSVASYLLALGPYFKTGGRGPSRLVEWVPMPGRFWLITPGIRWPSRIFFFAWLGGAILAGLGLTRVQSRIPANRRDIFGVCVVLLLVLEYWPSKSLAADSADVVSPLAMSDTYPYLAFETDSGGVIELPTANEPGAREELWGRYIYGASGHLRRIVALQGSRTLPLIDSLYAAGESLPQESGRNFLSSHGVTRVVVHKFLGDSAANRNRIASFRAARYPLLFNGREGAVFSLSGSIDKK